MVTVRQHFVPSAYKEKISREEGYEILERGLTF